jgi:hypothetical protein
MYEKKIMSVYAGPFLDLFNTFGLDNTIQTAILNP